MMRHLFSTLVCLAWGLWFGGIICLFLFVTKLLETFDLRRGIFGEAGSALFHVFGQYQMIVGGVAIIATFAWYLSSRSPWRIALFVLFAVSALCAVYTMTVILPRLDELRIHGKTATHEFHELHGRSMIIFLCETLLLLIAGLILPINTRIHSAPPPKIQAGTN